MSSHSPEPTTGDSSSAGDRRLRVFSGIQPTGSTHLGNYLGALRNWEKLQNDSDAIYCIVDLHALTTPKEHGEVLRGTLDIAKMLLAVGIDPVRQTGPLCIR